MTPTPTDDLLPCPFCGGDDVVIDDKSGITGNLFFVCCYGGGIHGCVQQDYSYATKREAIKAWNTRAYTRPVPAGLVALNYGGLAAHVAGALGALRVHVSGDTAAVKSLQYVQDELMKAYESVKAHAQPAVVSVEPQCEHDMHHADTIYHGSSPDYWKCSKCRHTEWR